MSVIVADTFRARVAGAAVTTTEGLNVGGACTATSFVGDGSNITGIANTDFINATQLNVIGVATASSFVGNVTGNTSGTAGGLTGTPDITVRNITGVAATFTGVLTYEDVTNVDSVGIVTARGGLEVGAAGVGGTITPQGNAIFVGVTTVGTGLTLADNVRAKFGNSGDLAVYHNGSHGYVENQVDGQDLNLISTKDIYLKTGDGASGTHTILYGADNGGIELRYDNSKKIETLSTGVNVTGVTSTTTLTVGPGLIQENLFTEASALTGAGNVDILTRGTVQYYTANSSGTFSLNIRGDGSTTFNSLMHIGQTTVLTFYSAQNNTSYYLTDFLIDGASQTEKWNGGTAPSAGGGSGVDCYTFNILKTANATFTVFATYSNFA